MTSIHFCKECEELLKAMGEPAFDLYDIAVKHFAQFVEPLKLAPNLSASHQIVNALESRGYVTSLDDIQGFIYVKPNGLQHIQGPQYSVCLHRGEHE